MPLDEARLGDISSLEHVQVTHLHRPWTSTRVRCRPSIVEPDTNHHHTVDSVVKVFVISLVIQSCDYVDYIHPVRMFFGIY